MPRPNAKKFRLGAWLPDLPDLDNPGILEALNVLPVGSDAFGYAPYLPLATGGSAFSTSSPLQIVTLRTQAVSGSYLYVGTQEGKLFQSSAAAGSWTNYAPAIYAAPQSLAQFNNDIFVTSGTQLAFKVVGDTNTATVVSGAPQGAVLGVIGQFLCMGNIQASPNVYPHLFAWSGILNPTSWPTPGSATAIAQQSGEQFLHQELGSITGIYGADQWGVILQTAGITRVNYVGGSTVFQFDTLASGIGMDFQNLGIKVGQSVYFASTKGFWQTDGVTLNPIGEEKVNRWFIANVLGVGSLAQGSVGVDWKNKIIVWAFPAAGATILCFYNFEQGRFSHAVDTNLTALFPGDDAIFSTYGLQAIGQDSKLGGFTGTAGTATLTSPEIEMNPGGKALLQGFKPLVSGSSPSVTCRIGSRFRQGDAVTFTSAITPNTGSGFADCLVEANYHRAEIDVAGAFTQAMGGEFIATPSGAF